MRSSTRSRDGTPHFDAVRVMIRRKGLAARKTSSFHASSSFDPAQMQTRSGHGSNAYRVELGLFRIVVCRSKRSGGRNSPAGD